LSAEVIVNVMKDMDLHHFQSMDLNEHM